MAKRRHPSTRDLRSMPDVGGAADLHPGPTRPRPGVTLEDKYRVAEGRVLLSGIDAIVRCILDQRRLDESRGLNTAGFVSGYEGSPLGGLDLEMQRNRGLLDAAGVVVSPGVNEELAATAVGGTQLLEELPGRRHQGVTGYWYGKNPGLDRAADPVRHGNYSGTAPLGGAVAWIGDDPTCKSSTIPSSCESMAKSLLVPLLAPSTVAEVRELGLHAVALSRFAGTWTAVKVVADIADGAATVDLTDPAGWIPAPDLTRQWSPSLLIGAQSMVAERDLLEVRLPRAAAYAAAQGLNRVTYQPARPRLGVIAAGLAYAAVRRALADLGIDEHGLESLGIRLVKMGVVWPVDPEHLRRMLGGLEEVVVIEDKAAFLETQVKEAFYRRPHPPLVVGKSDPEGRPLVPERGAVTSDLVARVLAARLGDALPESARRRLTQLDRTERLRVGAAPLASRTPYFCSGCPHNRSTRASDDALVGMGIGCHIMASFDPHGRGQAVGITQMGGEGAQWNGLFPFTDDDHFVQNLGDGTFFHSGSLAVRAAVDSGANITYKLLYNQAVAMTGGQAPVGGMPVPELTRWLAVEGVKRVVVATPDPEDYRGITLDPIAEVRHRDELDQIQAELAGIGGVTVLIYDDRCAAEERRLRKRDKLPSPAMRLWINERVCEGCGDCGQKSSCLSVVPVDTEFGRKTAIHQGSCNQDYSCLQGDCPSFVQVFPKRGNPSRATGTGIAVPPVDLVEPVRRVASDDVLIRMPGIGGTGVVTISRILQMAALLDGRFAAGVEQTGLSQKGGPVMSDVRISSQPIDAAVRAGARSTDVLLAFDPLGAADPTTLATADPHRTVVVMNTAEVATARMVTDPAVAYPERAKLTARVERDTRRGANLYLDANWISEQISDDHLATNMVLTGAAFQHGCLPITAASMEEAIRLNGVAVAANLAAFRWGRAAVIDPAGVRRGLAGPEPLPVATGATARTLLADHPIPEVLRPAIERRVDDLVGYQSTGYARRYLGQVLSVLAAELAQAPSPNLPVTAAFAQGLYKLMAYKDEYEVARLHLDGWERAKLSDEFGPGARVRVMLQPPILKKLGLRRKVSLGPAARPVFAILHAARHLRGNPLDPFGHTRLRRTERALVDEYLSLVSQALGHLDPASAPSVVEVAELPDLVRGYEGVKLAGIDRFRTEGALRLLAATDRRRLAVRSA
ncbi:MAG TPA: indolepyruvate ferredoxin oxidoreductase family protein [Acidimicrobiales bacterium]|nr:indolepyruvate ferredoxin oxidoreductase family protein [Acidimicrobiales bacterium]